MDKMEKFEYKIIESKPEIKGLYEELNSLGSKGWELVNTLCSNNGRDSDLTYLIFKRKIPQGSSSKGFIRGADYYADAFERSKERLKDELDFTEN